MPKPRKRQAIPNRSLKNANQPCTLAPNLSLSEMRERLSRRQAVAPNPTPAAAIRRERKNRCNALKFN